MDELQKKLAELGGLVRKEIGEGKVVRVITHHDADGLCAGAIVHKAISRLGGSVHTRSIKQFDSKTAKEMLADKSDLLVFVDMGSGQLDIIRELCDSRALVIDHHQPKDSSGDETHVNPHHFGIDGSREVSGAGMAYLFAKQLYADNLDLSALAIVGAVGDVQHEGGFTGINKQILGDAVRAGAIEVEKDLRIFGRQTRPLYKAIEYTTEPFIPGLSGSESSCIQFLSELKIPPKKEGGEYRILADLSLDERQRLVTALILKMIEHHVPVDVAESLVGEVYTLVNEDKNTPLRDAKEFATLLNGCGRHKSNGIGIAVCLGDRGAQYEKSLNLLKEHKNYISNCYAWVSKNIKRIEDRGVLYFLNAGSDIDSNLIGTVASMILSSKLVEPIKPIVAFADTEEGEVKVSSRGTKELVRNGLNLGRAMQYASERTGRGDGGGHDIAAGATISKGEEEKFISVVIEAVRRQIHADASSA